MRRLARHLLALCSTASLLLGVAVGVLWVRSYAARDTFSLGAHASGDASDGSMWEAFAVSTRGSLRINLNRQRWHYAADPNPFPGDTGPYWVARPPDVPTPIPTARDSWRSTTRTSPGVRVTGFDAFGFGVGHLATNWSTAPPASEWTNRSHTAARAPHWFVVLVLLIPPTFTTRRLLRTRLARQRRAAQRCLACGYDLRASPDRCPECGMPAAK
jgi:hypothetical protein